MKKVILILFSNLLFAQIIPEPRQINIPPRQKVTELNLLRVELKDALQPFINSEKYGIGVISYTAISGYSTTGASFSIYNPSQKTIKYIWFTVAGENPVGDLVQVSKGVYYKTLKAIGPVVTSGIAEWSFDYVWSTDIVEYLRLSNIKIQYMDGTFKTIKYNKNMHIGESAYEYAIILMNKKKNAELEEQEKTYSDFTLEMDKIYADVDQAPEFPGGVNAFRLKVSNSFNSSKMKGNEGTVKTEVTFIVERDGSITDVKAGGNNEDFNNEAIRSVNSIKNKWTPAKINGQSVRCIFRLPLTMNFE
ncbi:energy transducer TonB [Chryseobacterium wangxinyae]|uniref:energy transducer TonB n=1 Tax=Chryseobacterium sp. CY350 TaxID=2997336 RepID=UPI00226E8AD9|nr:energy transducer TonB [Chryseobacterium sp. CY350]MCY0978369.1 energy transducer TonB [Chryseobacterium sp. CY350]WBZ96146.1 energy transducer TonB [Chryseobacterium sp. CY350]